MMLLTSTAMITIIVIVVINGIVAVVLELATRSHPQVLADHTHRIAAFDRDSASIRRGRERYPFTLRSRGSIPSSAEAHQRRFWSLVRQRSTFAVRCSTCAPPLLPSTSSGIYGTIRTASLPPIGVPSVVSPFTTK